MAATLRLSTHVNITNNIPANHATELNRAILGAIVQATRFGRGVTEANTPQRTGRTARSVKSFVAGGGPIVEGHFGSDYEVFEFLERGTRPHIIEPRFKKALFWPGARHPVRRVRHPGTTAQHTLEHSAQAAGALAKDRLGETFEEVFG